MKKTLKIMMILVLAVMMSFVVATPAQAATATKSVALKSLAISSKTLTLNKGASKTLTVSLNPTNTTVNKTVTWTSSNASVATVKNGTITGKAAGTATITAKMGNVTATCKVTVKAVAPKFVDAKACYTTLNTYRKNAKVGAVKVDATLEKVAQTRAKELVTLYSHKRPNGESGLTLIKGNLYKGENIAMGQKTCAAVMSAWFNSASHKANMLGKNYTKVGVAGYEVNGQIYWVMVFSS